MHKIIKYISTCNHLHKLASTYFTLFYRSVHVLYTGIGMYDTMNHCRKFEEILMRT